MRAIPRWRFGEDPAVVAAVLTRGGLVALPTESSYGLAVDPLRADAVRRLDRVKARTRSKPLPVVISGPAQLSRLGIEWPVAELVDLADLWPAALSLLLPAVPEPPAAAGTGKLAVRVPAHAGLRELLEDLGMGLTATSANSTGEAPVLAPGELEELLAGHDALVVDGGRLPGGPPSTLVAFEGGVARVLRAGRVRLEELRRAAPRLVIEESFSAAAVEIPVEEGR